MQMFYTVSAFLDVSGKVVHAVARPPPSVRAQAGGTASGVDSQPQPTAARGAGGPQRSDNVLVSTFTLPSEVVDPHQIQVAHACQMSGTGHSRLFFNFEIKYTNGNGML